MSDSDLQDVSQDVFLGRQPILDRHQQLFAYELLFRGAAEGKADGFAAFVGGGPAPAEAIAGAFADLSLAEALGAYQGFVKAGPDLLFGEHIEALPPRAVVLEVSGAPGAPGDMAARCEELRQAGYILAARAPDALTPGDEALLKIAEVVKVDAGRAEPERLKRLAIALKPLRKTLLAEGVETAERRRLCHELGFDLFQGYWFARPATGETKRLKSSEAALLRLLGLISSDADTFEIEAVFKQEPILTINLLRLTNSVGSGLSTRIGSVRHAITLLGRRQLLRWLQLLLYSGATNASPAVNPLLQLAATRGRLMELLVDYTVEVNQFGRDLIDQGFMVGILSLMPAMLGDEAAETLAGLPLPLPVLDALGERLGVLGDLLTFVEALEEVSPAKAAAVAPRLPGIDAPRANACLARALNWANNLARESEDR
ncbi:MAG: HDOD domain-containing protein [Candidatus Accumulibacter sp.]|nr:HDOD domain-containing protein [Accumulibacter sp.]